MRLKLIAALTLLAILLSSVPGSAQTSGTMDFGIATQEAEVYSLGLRIAGLLQVFDDPASFQPMTAVAFKEYGRSGTSYYYENIRYACKVNIGYNNILPVLHGYVIENVECCTRAPPFMCRKYSEGQRPH
jgi:hypothetical protein